MQKFDFKGFLPLSDVDEKEREDHRRLNLLNPYKYGEISVVFSFVQPESVTCQLE